MPDPIGILVDQRVLRRALRGRPTLERIPLYRSIAIDDLKVDIVVFAVEHVDARRHTVRGYVPTATGWKRARLSVPGVIHKRVLYQESAPLRTLRRLERKGVIFVNPIKIQDKKRMASILAQSPAGAHLPPTRPYSWSRLQDMLNRGESAIVKPRIGSLGSGVTRVVPVDERRIEVTARSRRIVSRSALERKLRARASARRYILQRYIPLATHQDHPFDLRVPVQKDETGRWVIPGIVAKVARRHSFLTNMAQGGSAIPATKAITAAFGKEAPSVIQRVKELAVNVARAVAATHPYAADLGLDVGVDREGTPWLFEVNTRDQRYTFERAGLHKAFMELYRNPIAYCAALSQSVASRRR